MAEKLKRNRIFEYIKYFHADIIFLQETHNATVTDEHEWEKEWKGPCFWSRGSHRSCGVGILFKPECSLHVREIKRDTSGRVISLRVEHNGTELNLMNVYAPTIPNERKLFFENLWSYKPGDTNLLLAGDFNCVPDLKLDKLGGNLHLGDTGVQELNSFTYANDLIDAWRFTHPQDRLYTWNNHDYTIRSRLDRWYIPHMSRTSSNVNIRACPFSDHSAVDLNITQLNDNTRGKGVWKLNNTLLKDSAFCNEIKHVFKFMKDKQPDYQNLFSWWDETKAHFKTTAINYSIRKARHKSCREHTLLTELTREKQQPTPDSQRIETIKETLSELITDRLNGVKIRSRAQWTEEGEKPTSYFFKLERAKQSKACISKLKTDHGEATSDNDILKTARQFYQSLYTQETIDEACQTWLIDQLETRLDDLTSARCEGPMTLEELSLAISNMHCNKSPGPDGLTTEFYKTFWQQLAPDIVTIFNLAFEYGELTTSQKESLLRLLYKKGDRTWLTNWRPISLLNCDYKILSTALGNRLRPTLSTTIHTDQTCGIPGRTIFDNILRLRDMAYDAKINNRKLIMINIDQEKAFDRVCRSFLDKILKKMNYGPSFRRWINTIYTGANCQVINNGHLSDRIQLERGVRQGCPLSPLLYVITIETLCMAIRKHPRINGIRIPGTPQESKISAYADDCTLTLQDDLSVTYAFDTIGDYERASGSKLNLKKTEGTYIGAQAGRDHGPVPITWDTTGIQVLGTHIGNNMAQDWAKVASKIETILERWAHRQLTLNGKTVLIKTYAIASAVYLASIFIMPETISNRIHRAMFSFLWSGRNELVSRETCHQPFAKGGLDIPDFHKLSVLFLAKWIKAIISKEHTAMWLHYARYWTGHTLGNTQTEWAWLKSNLKPHGNPAKTPPWYDALITFVLNNRKTLENTASDCITCRFIKGLLANDIHPKAENEWKKYIHPTPNFDSLWIQNWHALFDNKVKEFMWKLTHRVLTTKEYLKRWGMQIDPHCPFCQHNEDTHHALISCARAHQLWTKVQGIIKHVAGFEIHVSLETIVFKRGLPQKEPLRTICHYIIATSAYHLWHSRNQKIYKNNFNNKDTYCIIMKQLKQTVELAAQKHPRTFENVWAFKNILVSVKDGKIKWNVKI